MVHILKCICCIQLLTITHFLPLVPMWVNRTNYKVDLNTQFLDHCKILANNPFWRSLLNFFLRCLWWPRRTLSHFTFPFLISHFHFSFRIPISHFAFPFLISHSHFSFRIPISHFTFPFLILHSHFSFRSLTHMYTYNCIQVCMVTSINRSRKEMSELNSSADDTVAAGKERVSSSKRMQTV